MKTLLSIILALALCMMCVGAFAQTPQNIGNKNLGVRTPGYFSADSTLRVNLSDTAATKAAYPTYLMEGRMARQDGVAYIYHNGKFEPLSPVGSGSLDTAAVAAMIAAGDSATFDRASISDSLLLWYLDAAKQNKLTVAQIDTGISRLSGDTLFLRTYGDTSGGGGTIPSLSEVLAVGNTFSGRIEATPGSYPQILLKSNDYEGYLSLGWDSSVGVKKPVLRVGDYSDIYGGYIGETIITKDSIVSQNLAMYLPLTGHRVTFGSLGDNHSFDLYVKMPMNYAGRKGLTEVTMATVEQVTDSLSKARSDLSAAIHDTAIMYADTNKIPGLTARLAQIGSGGGTPPWSVSSSDVYYDAGNVFAGSVPAASNYRLNIKSQVQGLRIVSDNAPLPSGTSVGAMGEDMMIIDNRLNGGMSFINYDTHAGAFTGLSFASDTASNGDIIPRASIRYKTDTKSLELASTDTSGSAPAIKFTTYAHAFDFYGNYLARHLLYVDATNGRTGINTNTPGYDLDVNGSFSAGGASNRLLYDNTTSRLFLNTNIASSAFQITKPNVGFSDFITMRDGNTNGGITLGSSSSNFIPSIKLNPGTSAVQSSSMIAYTTDPTDTNPAFSIDVRKTGGPLVNQPLFSIASYGNKYFTIQAGGSVLYNTVSSTPPDPPAGSTVQWFDGTNMKWKKNVGGTVTSGTLY